MTSSRDGVWLEVLLDVVRALRALRGRTLLALIAIAIGTAAVVAMLHVGHNARNEALRQFEGMGIDLVTIIPLPDDTSSAQIPIDIVADLPFQGLGIEIAAGIVRSNVGIRTGRQRTSVELLATSGELFELGNITPRIGRLIGDLDKSSPFAVLGANVAAEIGLDRGVSMAVGEQITLNDQVFTVVGVLDSTAPNLVLGLDPNRSVIIPFKASRRLDPKSNINVIIARTAKGMDENTLLFGVTNYFQIAAAGMAVDVHTARQLIAGVEAQMRIYSLLLLAIGAVSLIVGGVGIMNVMLMNVMERRQEIGIRQAVGARRRDIRRMFLAEAILLASIGSSVGTILGFLGGWFFAVASSWDFTAAPLAVPLGAGMALVVGLFFGIYPAIRASRLHPVAALRSQ